MLPHVPPANIHWVCDVKSVEKMRDAVLGAEGNPTTREGHPPLVGVSSEERYPLLVGVGGDPPLVEVDGEWSPVYRKVCILQVATRKKVFVVDLLAVASSGSPACHAFDALLNDMLTSETVYKLGLTFDEDLRRMRCSYPHLTSLHGGRGAPNAVVDVRQLVYPASANKTHVDVGLATLTKFVLGAKLRPVKARPNWARRPLKKSQLAYAAANAYYLILIFDTCVAQSNTKLLTHLQSDLQVCACPRNHRFTCPTCPMWTPKISAMSSHPTCHFSTQHCFHDRTKTCGDQLHTSSARGTPRTNRSFGVVKAHPLMMATNIIAHFSCHTLIAQEFAHYIEQVPPIPSR